MTPNLNLGDTQLILAECRGSGLSLQQAAYVMATAYWETARTVKPVKEAYWVKNAETWREKNLRYYPWYGRGYVQLTWQQNYIKAGNKLSLDLTTDPDLVMQPRISAKILVRGCIEGWFTGKSLGDYIADGRVDFISARRVVNGTDKATEIATIAEGYVKALTDASYTAQPERSIPATSPLAAIIAALIAIFKGARS